MKNILFIILNFDLLRFLLVNTLIAVFSVQAAFASFSAATGIDSQRVQFDVVGGQNNQYGWEADFNIGYSAATMTFEIELGLGFYGAEPGDGLLNTWESGIESKWSNQFFVIDDDSNLYNVAVNADLFTVSDYLASPVSDRPTIHHAIQVTDGVGAVNLNSWYTNPINPFGQDQLAAHEIGHLFGNFDEYASGAVNPNDSLTWSVHDSLMGGGLTNTLYDRHFQFVLDWLADVEQQPVEDLGFSLVSASQLPPPAPVPVPSAAWLFGSALLGIVIQKRKCN